MDTSYADPYRSLGLLYMDKKNYSTAITCFNKYLNLKPKARDYRWIKSKIRRANRRIKALKKYEENTNEK